MVNSWRKVGKVVEQLENKENCWRIFGEYWEKLENRWKIVRNVGEYLRIVGEKVNSWR